MLPTAVVMNMYYTGLGIARSLGERGVPVVGLTSQRGVYGSFTRYAKTLLSPDSRQEPERLAAYLVEFGKRQSHRSVIFPTRDNDVIFLDCYRDQLAPYFVPVIPGREALRASLDKWETFVRATDASVATPKCWLIESTSDLACMANEPSYPCVLKPVSAHQWRQGKNWEIVGGRKAVCVSSEAELRAEYSSIARADARALLQEMIPGSDDCIVIVACYLDSESNCVASFNTRKLVQIPEGFGTGCIVEAVDRPELLESTVRLLQRLQFTGIAEVEYKWHAGKHEHQLIEINPRPWDQHRLGGAVGVDLVWTAYRDHAGLPAGDRAPRREFGCKWIAEDAFILSALRLWRLGDPRLKVLMSHARGRKMFAIWLARDPLPFIVFAGRFALDLAGAGLRWLRSAIKRRGGEDSRRDKSLVY